MEILHFANYVNKFMSREFIFSLSKLIHNFTWSRWFRQKVINFHPLIFIIYKYLIFVITNKCYSKLFKKEVIKLMKSELLLSLKKLANHFCLPHKSREIRKRSKWLKRINYYHYFFSFVCETRACDDECYASS
jgi:hypothetical protein